MLSCQAKFVISPTVAVGDGLPYTISFAPNNLEGCSARCEPYNFIAITQLVDSNGPIACGCRNTFPSILLSLLNDVLGTCNARCGLSGLQRCGGISAGIADLQSSFTNNVIAVFKKE
jgi:hypothetical protein